MRKMWPSEDNCSRLVRNSHNTFRLCEACAKLAQPMHGAKFPLFLPTPLQIFSYVIFLCNFLSYPCNQPITSFFFCKDNIRGGNHLLKHREHVCYVLHLVKYRALSFPFFLYYFLFLGSQTTSEDVFPEDEAKLLVSWSEGSQVKSPDAKVENSRALNTGSWSS